MTYTTTKISCYLGYFTQAIVANMTAILFVPLMILYNLSYSSLSILIFVNFISQIAADILFSKLPDKYGFRIFAVLGAVMSIIGLILFALSPFIFPDYVFIGLIIGTIIFSVAGGLIELILSPLVNLIPSPDHKKGSSMALLHSFYAWGFVFTVIVTSLLNYLLPQNLWFFIPLLWSIIPLLCLILWTKVPMPKIELKTVEQKKEHKKMMLNPLLLIFMLAIMLGGATEVVISQWASVFTELGLGVNKLTGDLLGPCMFAVMLGTGRILYGFFENKINLNKLLIISLTVTIFLYIGVAMPLPPVYSLICIALCGLSTCMLWPGTLVLAAKYFPSAGVFMFAMLAAMGDIGAAAGPMVTGFIADAFNTIDYLNIATYFNITTEQFALRLAILIGTIYPLLTLILHFNAIKKIKTLHKLKEF
jgi:fucose permease